jgi:hypothetical protein
MLNIINLNHLPCFLKFVKSPKEVDAEKIQKSLRELVEQLSGIMKENKIKMGSLHLSELEVNVEITAEGGVALVGVAKAGIKGAITLKFSR